MADLRTSIGKLELANPVMTASGTFGYGTEFADFVDLEKLGGVIVKGTTLHHREGNPYPRMAETPAGMLNAVGLQNKGVDYFAENIYPQLKDLDTNVIVNVSGACIEDYVATAEKVAALDAIPAIIVDEDFFVIVDNLIEFTEQYNGEGLYWNYFYHTWKTFAVSPFANAVVFVPNTPSVTSVAVTPSTATAGAGDIVRLEATVVTANYAPQSVNWTSSDETVATVDKNGVHTHKIADVPEMQKNLILSVKHYENLTVEAIIERDKAKAVKALTVHPLICSYPIAEKLVDAYTEKYGKYIGEWHG